MYLGYGPLVDKFEEEYARFSGYKYNIGTNSASAAAFIIFQWLKEDQPYTVITPTLGFTSPAWAAKHAGHKLMFCDVTDHLQMKAPSLLANTIYMPVYYGGVSRTGWSQSILERSVIDSAHCVQPTEKGLATFFSFFYTKPIRMINGGMISTDNSDLAEYARLYRNFGRISSDGGQYSISYEGFRFYMDQPNAQMGLDALPKLKGQRELRKAYFHIYRAQLANYGYFAVHDPGSSYYLCTLILNEPIAGKLRDSLSCPLHYPLLHEQPAYKDTERYLEIEKAEQLENRIINLPISHEQSVDDILGRINRFKDLVN